MKTSILFMAFILIISMTSCSDNESESTIAKDEISITHLSLPNEETTIYQYHPVKVKVAIKLNNADISSRTKEMSLSVGLVNKDDSTQSCAFATEKVALETDGTELVTIMEGYPSEECLSSNEINRNVNFQVSVRPVDDLLNINGIDDMTFVSFTSDNSNNDANKECTDDSNTPGCVIDLFLEQSPGVDIILTKFKPASSVAILWSHNDADNQEQNVTLSSDVANTPNFEVDTEVKVVGVSTGVLNALEGHGDVYIQYAIRPQGTAEDWKGLTIRAANNHTAVGHDVNIKLTSLPSPSEKAFDHYLYIEGDAYSAMSSNGSWESYDTFELRACAIAGFTESSIADESTNNCITDTVIIGNQRKAGPLIQDNYRWAVNYYKVPKFGNNKESVTVLSSLEIGAGISSTHTNAFNSGSPYYNTATASFNLRATLSGWLDATLVDIDGSMYANLTNKTLNIKEYASILGHSLSSHDNTHVLPYTYSPRDIEVKYSKSLCSNYGYYLVVAKLGLDICATGTAEATEKSSFSFYDSGATGALAGSSLWGNMTFGIRPSVEADLSVEGTADTGILKASIKAKLTLLNASLNSQKRTDGNTEYKNYVTGEIDAGLVGTSTVFTAKSDADFTVSTLSGDVVATGEYWAWRWHELGHRTITSWSGYSNSTPLFHGTLGTTTVEQ